MDIFYDRPAGRAKVIVHQGIDAGKVFLRLYESNEEYMVREGNFACCRRSYLGEYHDLPKIVSMESTLLVIHGFVGELDALETTAIATPVETLHRGPRVPGRGKSAFHQGPTAVEILKDICKTTTFWEVADWSQHHIVYCIVHHIPTSEF